jgi:hypothetical protein
MRVVHSPLKTRREHELVFLLFVYLLTGWIWWFVFLPFILFDFCKHHEVKNFKLQIMLL